MPILAGDFSMFVLNVIALLNLVLCALGLLMALLLCMFFARSKDETGKRVAHKFFYESLHFLALGFVGLGIYNNFSLNDWMICALAQTPILFLSIYYSYRLYKYFRNL
jgi:hypothetical protein